MNFVTQLECANCGVRYEKGKINNLCTACNRPLWVKYDLAALKKNFKKKDLEGRPPTIGRYLEMLPISNPDKIVSLTEAHRNHFANSRLQTARSAFRHEKHFKQAPILIVSRVYRRGGSPTSGWVLRR